MTRREVRREGLRRHVAAALAFAFAAGSDAAAEVPDASAAASPSAQTGVPAATAPAAGANVRMIYLGKHYDEPPPLSLVDKVLTDQGVQGARVAVDENNKTGRLIGQAYTLEEAIGDRDASAVETARGVLASGARLLIADLEATDLLAVADLPEATDALIIDMRTSDDALRATECRRNILHVRPSTAMKADALAQYLAWKRWTRWLLISGKRPKDLAYSAAIKRAANRFGAKIVDERSYTFEAGSRRTDTGHQQIQTQMPLLTQGAPGHDVVIVADEEETFGDYVLFRTSEPRPVAGTHGLIATAWHRSFEEYAATQMQNRFERRAHRTMTERDYTAWLAVRLIGEAVTRTGRNAAQDLKDYILSDAFEVAGFKGQGMNFRKWDHQMRQPVLIAGPRAMISISPQEGFLHQRYLTDTLGVDEPESKCHMKKPTAKAGGAK